MKNIRDISQEVLDKLKYSKIEETQCCDKSNKHE